MKPGDQSLAGGDKTRGGARELVGVSTRGRAKDLHDISRASEPWGMDGARGDDGDYGVGR